MTNDYGLPVCEMPAGEYNGEPVEAGVFVDWRDDRVGPFVARLREVRPQDCPTFQTIAEQYGFQHDVHVYRALDRYCRRWAEFAKRMADY